MVVAFPTTLGADGRPLLTRLDRTPPPLETPIGPLQTVQAFTCTGRTCGQMSSCAEACHALLVCGDRRRDGDNDGIPGENLCSQRC
jgi:hypothetical protein